eukprot:TRINITY_DN9010_c1_g1_i2.p1 TRINITY_DN9010_c1_g1~~TRINITY_DN9010_c1_g1_i2.p1  ORF type:complete len:401 (+),score=98.09 TRINITY_DN9010_c1_g1_i2:58-1203(+)
MAAVVRIPSPSPPLGTASRRRVPVDGPAASPPPALPPLQLPSRWQDTSGRWKRRGLIACGMFMVALSGTSAAVSTPARPVIVPAPAVSPGRRSLLLRPSVPAVIQPPQLHAPPWVRLPSSPGVLTMVHEVFDVAAPDASRPTDDEWLIRVVETGARGEPVGELPLASAALHWYNRPRGDCLLDDRSGNLIMRADEGSEFWQNPAASNSSDHGHFLHIEAPQREGECIVLSTRVSLGGREAGDCVGLMVRRGRSAWVTSALSMPRAAGSPHIRSVVTNNAVSENTPTSCGGCRTTSLRMRVHGDLIVLEVTQDPLEREERWRTVRVAQLHDVGDEKGREQVAVGAFVSAPGQAGMAAAFGYLSVIRRPCNVSELANAGGRVQ